MSNFVVLTGEAKDLLESISKCFEGIDALPSLPDEDEYLYEDE